MTYPAELPIGKEFKLTLLLLTKPGADGKAASIKAVYESPINTLIKDFIIDNTALLDKAVKEGFVSEADKKALIDAATALLAVHGNAVLKRSLADQFTHPNSSWDKVPEIAKYFREMERIGFLLPFMTLPDKGNTRKETTAALQAFLAEVGDQPVEALYSLPSTKAGFTVRKLGITRPYREPKAK